LCQGVVLTAVVWLLLRFSVKTSAATRYSIWWATLAIVLLLPCLRLTGALGDPQPPVSGAPLPLHFASVWSSAIGVAWTVIAALLLGRLVWSYGYVRWLQRTATPLDASWQQFARRVTGSRRAQVWASPETPVPVVAGLWKTAILLPQDLADELTQAEMEQILLHEWAHVRRLDNWTNGALEVLQALYFFHPAVWLIGRRLRLERELACDDAVVRATGQPVSYAECLAKLVERHSCPPVSLSAGASGDNRDLFGRVERLLRWQGAAAFSALRFAAAVFMLLGAGALSREVPALVDLPAPRLSLAQPRPAIEVYRREMVAQESVRTAGFLMETARRRMDEADHMLAAARQQLLLATRLSRPILILPVSRAVCPQPAPAEPPKLNKI
jgi:hypothetical protein